MGKLDYSEDHIYFEPPEFKKSGSNIMAMGTKDTKETKGKPKEKKANVNYLQHLLVCFTWYPLHDMGNESAQNSCL